MSEGEDFRSRARDFLSGATESLSRIFLIVCAAILATSGILFASWSVGTVIEDSLVGWILLIPFLIFLTLYVLSLLEVVGDPIKKVVSGLVSGGGVGLAIAGVFLPQEMVFYQMTFPEDVAIISLIYFVLGLMILSAANFTPVRSFTYTAGIMGLILIAIGFRDLRIESAEILSGMLGYFGAAFLFGIFEEVTGEIYRNIFRSLTAVSVGMGAFLYYQLLIESSATTETLAAGTIAMGVIAFLALAFSIHLIKEGE